MEKNALKKKYVVNKKYIHPYKCRFCGRNFKNLWALRAHLRFCPNRPKNIKRKEMEEKEKTNKKNKNKEIDELDLSNIYDCLIKKMTDFDVRKQTAKGIVDLFQSYDEKNFAKLDDLMRLAGVPYNTRQLILMYWATLVGVNPDYVQKLIEQQRNE